MLDPRSRATRAELTEQFEWAQRVFRDLVAARRTANQLEAFEAQAAKSAEAKVPGIADAAKAVAARAGAILTGGNGKPEEGLQTVTRGLTAAFSALESANRTPPAQVIALYQQNATALKRCLTDSNALMGSTVPSLNRQLRGAGLPEIRTPPQ